MRSQLSIKSKFSVVDDNGEPINEDTPTIEQEERMIERSLTEAAEHAAANGTTSGGKGSNGFNDFQTQNYPIVCNTYVDPITDTEKVLLVVSMPGGSQNVKVELVDDGQSALIKYSWPKSMYDIDDLFRAQLDKNDLTSHHPLVLCFKAGLQETRKRIDFAPIASFKVNLPIKVQVAPGSCKRWGIMRADGTQVLISCFTGLAKDYIVTETDDVVHFGR